MRIPITPVAPSPEVCVRCKGRLWCGLKCYILEKQATYEKSASQIKGTSFSGSSPPGFFVSHYNYPKVNVAPLSPTEHLANASILDDSDKWFGLPEGKIISFRQQLVKSSTPFAVNSASNPSYELAGLQELVLSSEPTGVDVELKSAPKQSLSFSDTFAPIGPSAELKKFSLSENPSVDRKVDYIVSDTDAKAGDGMEELFSHGIGVNHLHKLLSAGLLGEQKRRKLVPTRWSITAVDSNLSEYILEERVRHFPAIDGAQVFESHYLDNHFHVLLLPREWGFEVLEAWKAGGIWTEGASEPQIISDHEFFEGRVSYAENVAGGYYAARLAVCEHLLEKKRQARAIIFREIGSGYKIPLGVWQVRENMRNAMRSKPISFSSPGLALGFLEKRLTIPFKFFKRQSALLDDLLHQRTLKAFI